MLVVITIASLALFLLPACAEQRPHCTCAIVDKCDKSVAGNLSSCWTQCSKDLKDYVKGTDKLEACFPGIGKEIKAVDQCVRKKIQGFCSHDATNATVAKPDTAVFLKAYNITDGAESNSAFRRLVKKARTAFAKFRRFQYCFANCVKENAFACHETNGMNY
ncbi:hypothetical protein AAVH_13387 [Aphelenchoides avenae]|nr:hypothetical protein AAVH_13387 [Aphelenchus avenae]